jgi:AbrB family looped-hinge helix DNA binding protein
LRGCAILLAIIATFWQYDGTSSINPFQQEPIAMDSMPQVYRLKVDTSGRILLPSEVREDRHIEGGDTVMVVNDSLGLHIKTLDEILREVQAEFAKHVPRGVLLSEEILADRRSEIERD